MDIKVMKKRIEILQSKYDKDFENEESMSNDLLDQAERLMVYQRKIISELEILNRDFVEFLKDMAKWEANMIMEDEVWSSGYPLWTKEIYDRYMELQSKRNELLEKAKGG